MYEDQFVEGIPLQTMSKRAKDVELSDRTLFQRITIILICSYIIVTVLFYFLADEQLHLRESRGDITSLEADKVTVEMTAGTVIEQVFSTKIQRLEQVSLFWGTYNRNNTGTVILELYDTHSGTLLISGVFDMSEITEGGLTKLVMDKPLEGLYNIPLLLRIYSPDGKLGCSITPLMNSSAQINDWTLNINGKITPGVLCLAASGKDLIWIGLHYWEFAGAGLIVLIIILLCVWSHFQKGKHSYIINALVAIRRYSFLIRQLVSRDFKTKYKRSILGVFWSFLNPLLTMSVQYFVFSNIFRNDIPNFAVYLLIGVVMFNFFTESCGLALTSILSNANLITKVYMPKYIYPLTRVLSSVINLGISLIPLLIVCVATGVRFHKSIILSIFFILCLVILCLGVGLLLSTSMVFFRDTQFLWGVLSMMWMYATPIFYPEEILPEKFSFILRINPLYYLLKNTRICILDGISPEPIVYIQCMLMVVVILIIGAMVFTRCQDKFVLYL